MKGSDVATLIAWVIVGVVVGIFAGPAFAIGWCLGRLLIIGGVATYRWAIRGTVPAADVEAILRAKDEAWLAAPTPPIPFKASWEDDSLFAEHVPNPNIAIVQKMRDEAIERQDWNRAVELADQVLRLMESDSAPGVIKTDRKRLAGPEYCDTSLRGGGSLALDERRRREKIKKYRERLARDAEAAPEVRRRMGEKRRMGARSGAPYQTTDNGFIVVFNEHGKIFIDPRNVQAIQRAPTDDSVTVYFMDGHQEVFMRYDPRGSAAAHISREFENASNPNALIVLEEGMKVKHFDDLAVRAEAAISKMSLQQLAEVKADLETRNAKQIEAERDLMADRTGWDR